MDLTAASAIYQVVNFRYEKQHSTIVTTNRSLPDFGEIFGDTVVASAILDRLMHNAVVFDIKGLTAATRTLRPHHRHHRPHETGPPLTSPPGRTHHPRRDFH